MWMTISSLQNLCINYIVEKVNNNNLALKTQLSFYYFEEHILFIQHKKKMTETLRYFDLVNDNINNSDRNISILSIKYLRGEDFFSYNHLLVTFCRIPSELIKRNNKLLRQYVRCHSFIKI